MKNNLKDILTQMTLDDKIAMLTGFSAMGTKPLERLGISEKIMADGPHGIRAAKEKNNTYFPSTVCIASAWSTDLCEEVGSAMADECINNGVDLLLAPGMNIKRSILCGRNFEYFSEDPVVSGELAAAYINGVEKYGVGTSVKHFAVNNQEKYRSTISVEADMRTLMEIYLKGFEIMLKKSSPTSVMCANNRVGAIWCSENKFLLTDVLRQRFGYEGFVISDWCAVKNPCRALKAGMDLQMPRNENLLSEIKTGLEKGEITEADIDAAAERILRFAMRKKAKKAEYDRQKQHMIAKKAAAEGIVLLKNENNCLPITKEKYKKIAVFGEFAESPLIGGQGSSEVYPNPAFVDSPLEKLRENLDGTEIVYSEFYKKRDYLDEMIWPRADEFSETVKDADLVLMFIGSMVSEDTEEFDRRTAHFNPNFEFYINYAVGCGKKVAVIMQNGGAMILDTWRDKVDAIIETWLGGESGGGAAADVLTGRINPSGKLCETFPSKLRTDMEYPGDGVKIRYNEGLDVGYRYYDKHPEEIVYPFGFGLSYTEFEYSNPQISCRNGKIRVSCTVKNIGEYDGSEIVQFYVSKPDSSVTRPPKELKAFKKVHIKRGESKKAAAEIDCADLAYFNTMLDGWVTEPGEYVFYIAASSRDIRLEKRIKIDADAPYTTDIQSSGEVGML